MSQVEWIAFEKDNKTFHPAYIGQHKLFRKQGYTGGYTEQSLDEWAENCGFFDDEVTYFRFVED